MTMPGTKPDWLTFDCYGTLIQWDEGLLAAVERILAKRAGARVDAPTLIATYDRHEHELERQQPHRSFRTVAGEGLRMATAELGLACTPSDVETLTSSISGMPPFPEVVGALSELKRQGFRICIISNTDDDIAGNVEQLGGHVDRVIRTQQAQAYKPSRRTFEHAHRALSVEGDNFVHICASPHLDLAAARDMGFRCVWIDRGTARRPLPDYVPNAVFSTLDRVPVYFGSLGWA